MGGGVQVCATPTATGCLVSWNVFDAAGDPSTFVRGTQARHAVRFGSSEGNDILCINPLTFDISQPQAAASQNAGSLPARAGVGLAAALKAGVSLPATEPARIAARCEGGVLRVEGVPREGYAIVPLPGGMLHFNDFDLFYANIRANAVARSAAFKAAAP